VVHQDMHGTQFLQQNFHRSQRFFLLVGMLGVLLAAIFLRAGTAYAASMPGGNVADPVVRAVDIAKPAIVRIITSISGHLDVQFNSGTVTFPQANSKTYQEELSGTGTFITSSGDILTADHVVSPPPDVLQTAAATDVANYINQHPETGIGQTTADQVTQALQTNQLKSTAHYDQKSSEVFLSTDYTGPLTAQTLATVPPQIHATVDRIEKESPFDQMDVAIVHAPFQDTPEVQLGDSSNVQTQDPLTIIGFPGNADVNDIPQNLFTSSVNSITVSSIKTTTSGAPLIQVGGNVEHGDSGGPALDSQGNVVGVVSFGLSSNNSPGNTSFLQASNSARQLVTALNLKTTPGTFEKQWDQAFADYAATSAGHWHTSQQEFQQLATSYPQFKAITPYLTYAQDQAKTETVPQGQQTTATPQAGNHSQAATASPTSWKAIALTIGAIALVVLLIIALLGMMLRGRKKKAQPAQNGAQPQQPLPTVPRSSAPDAMHNGMTAFGAPPPVGSRPMPPQPGQSTTFQRVPGQPVPVGSSSQASDLQSTFILRPWPCGHMNRPNARFCSICGEPAPPTSRRVEQ
jgi:serine protease Do